MKKAAAAVISVFILLTAVMAALGYLEVFKDDYEVWIRVPDPPFKPEILIKEFKAEDDEDAYLSGLARYVTHNEMAIDHPDYFRNADYFEVRNEKGVDISTILDDQVKERIQRSVESAAD